MNLFFRLTAFFEENNICSGSMKIKSFLFVVFFFSFLFIFPARISAQEIPTVGANLSVYVPPTGSECNINVPSQYSTIQAGIDAANSGDTICVGPGVYNEDVLINRIVRLSGSGYNKTIINGQIGGLPSTVNITVNDIILEGFQINNIDPGYKYYGASVGLPRFISGAIVRYNRMVAGNGGLAFSADSGGDSDLVQNNILEGNDSLQIAWVNYSNKVDFLNNTFTGTVAISSTLEDSGLVLVDWATNSTIKQNIFDTSGTFKRLMDVGFSSSILTENNLNSNAAIKVSAVITPTPLNAENNWWGDTDPSDNFYGDVDYSNFATSPFPEYPGIPLQTYQTAAFYDFNNGSTDGWLFGCSPTGCGNWRVENGALAQDSGFDGVTATIADRQFSNQIIETDAMFNGPSGDGGVSFWVNDNIDKNSVVVGLGAGSVSLRQDINGIEASYTTPYDIRLGTWYRLKVVADSISGIVDVYIDGNYLFSYAVTNLNRTGTSGVYFGNAGGFIDNFKLSVPLVLNQPPIANAGRDQTGNEGSQVSFDGSQSTDPDGTADIVNYNWNFGDGTTGSGVILSHTYKNNGTYTATLIVTDSAGNTSSDSAQITINNVAPSVGVITGPSTTPIVTNTSVSAASSFTDPGTLDTHTASWNWGDGSTLTGTVTENNGSGSVSDSHTYTVTGVYTITLTVADKDNGTGTSIFQYVSVYNPTPQGLFSGARIFNDPATNGKVMFGVSTKYSGTTPTGKVSMNFKSSRLDFTSISIDSLVTSNGMATVRGSGTLNGNSGYTFLVTGIDSSQTGGQTIRFQIKDSSNNVVYDTQPGASDIASPTTSVTGQIIVH